MLDYEQIKAVLPQRFPFAMVDRIIELEPRKRVVGIKNITGNEICFLGHFPDKAIFPAVLIIEAMAQTALFLYYDEKKKNQKLEFYLGVVKGCRFLKPVYPGDQLRIECEPFRITSDNATVKILVSIDREKAVEGEMIFVRRKKHE